MPRKAERDVEIFEPTDPGPEDRIVVERVLVVVPGPVALDLQRLERRDPLGEAGPDRLVEIGIVDLPVKSMRLPIGRVTADVSAALWSEADIAADVTGQWHPLELLADLKIESQ